MERHQNLFEEIESYLAGKMDGDQLNAFEDKMILDKELREEVEKHRILSSELSETKTLAFQEMLQKVSDEVKTEKQEPDFVKKKSNLSLIWKVAAMIFLVSGIVFISQIDLNSDSHKELYSMNYRQFPFEGKQRGVNDDNRLENARNSYNNKQFANAIDELKVLLQENPEKDRLKLYLANCYLQVNQDTQAIQLLEELSLTSIYFEENNWYLSLAYLKVNNLEYAKKSLKKVIEYNGVKKEMAKSLFDSIERI